MDEVTDARRRKIATARARVRRHVWAQLAAAGGVPASRVAGTDLGETVVLDVDATIVVTHSEKELASPTFKKTFGYHPIGVWCDNTGEFLAAALRTGRAGSNTAVDHIQVLGEAITQIPMPYRRNLLIRCDGAGASHQLLDWLPRDRLNRQPLRPMKPSDLGPILHTDHSLTLTDRGQNSLGATGSVFTRHRQTSHAHREEEQARNRETPLLADGREEIFLPEWLKTGSYNLVRVADEKPPSKPLAK